jgi:hypothetical protein
MDRNETEIFVDCLRNTFDRIAVLILTSEMLNFLEIVRGYNRLY